MIITFICIIVHIIKESNYCFTLFFTFLEVFKYSAQLILSSGTFSANKGFVSLLPLGATGNDGIILKYNFFNTSDGTLLAIICFAFVIRYDKYKNHHLFLEEPLP